MKTARLIILLLLISKISLAQETIEKEVNQNLWKPWVEAWVNLDAKSFNALHTADVLRVSGNRLRKGESYHEMNRQNFERMSQSPATRSIRFWFEQRVYNGNDGYEVGYYKITSKQEGQEERAFFARFHVVLRKENGQWKIAQDWDSSQINGVPVTAEDWAKGTPLDF